MNLCLTENSEACPVSKRPYSNGWITNENERIYNPDIQNEEYNFESIKTTSFLNIHVSPEMKEATSTKYSSRMSSNLSNKEISFEKKASRKFPADLSLSSEDFAALNSYGQKNSQFSNYNPNRSYYIYNNSPIGNEGDKKFISELHIDIKDPIQKDGDNLVSCNEMVVPKYQTVHSSNFQSCMGDHSSEYGVDQRRIATSSDKTSNSSESPERKQQYHHSESFIYLGGNPQVSLKMTDQDYELCSYHSSVEILEDGEHHSSPLSEQSLINDESKSFSSKSVQTSKKIDCIFKTTCNIGVETDLPGVTFEIPIEDKKITKTLHNNCDNKSSSTSSNNICVEHTDFLEEKQRKVKHNFSKDYHENSQDYHKNFKRTNSGIRGSEKSQIQPSYNFSNQDTDIGSYSESFNRSSDSFAKEKNLVKPFRYSKSTIPSKTHKRFSDRNKIIESDETSKSMARSMVKEKKKRDSQSQEIEGLLDNLNIRFHNSVNSQRRNNTSLKPCNTLFNPTNSFWDNPLNSETTRSLFLNKPASSKIRQINRCKTVNPEIQAIFETLEKSKKLSEKGDFGNNKSEDLPICELSPLFNKPHKFSINEHHPMKKCCDGMGSVDNLTDLRFPSNFKFKKSFELNPYDELVKSHQNSVDRRIKSVAAKNDCQIVIDGPLSLTDVTSTCHAIRNKIAYRCTVAGATKDRLDKCLNYLKETFPNTCLRTHSRNNVTVKS